MSKTEHKTHDCTNRATDDPSDLMFAIPLPWVHFSRLYVRSLSRNSIHRWKPPLGPGEPTRHQLYVIAGVMGKDTFGIKIDKARAKPVLKHGRGVVVVEECNGWRPAQRQQG
jgi:hypothetical protein